MKRARGVCFVVLTLVLPGVPSVAWGGPSSARLTSVPRAATPPDPNEKRARQQLAAIASAVGDVLDGAVSKLGDEAQATGEVPLIGDQARQVLDPVRAVAVKARDAIVNDLVPFVDGRDDESIKALVPAAIFVLLGPKDAIDQMSPALRQKLQVLAPLNLGADLVVAGGDGPATVDDVHFAITDNDVTLQVTLGQSFDLSLSGVSLTPNASSPPPSSTTTPPKVGAADYVPDFGDQLGIGNRLKLTATWRARVGVGVSTTSLPYLIVPANGDPLADATVVATVQADDGGPLSGTVDLGLMRLSVTDGVPANARVTASAPVALVGGSGITGIGLAVTTEGDAAPVRHTIGLDATLAATLPSAVVALNASLLAAWTALPPVEFVAEPSPAEHTIHLALVARDPKVTAITITGATALGFSDGQGNEVAPGTTERSQVLLTAGVTLAGDGGDQVPLDQISESISAFARADARVRLHLGAASGSLTDAVSAAVASTVAGGKFTAAWPELSFDLKFDIGAGVSTADKADDEEGASPIEVGRLQFDNVTLDLRQFLRQVVVPFARSAIDAVRPLTEAIGSGSGVDPDTVLDREIPVVSDLAPQKYTLRDLDRDVFDGALAGGGLQELLDALQSIHDLPDDLEKKLGEIDDAKARVVIGCIEPDLDDESPTYIGTIETPLPCEAISLARSTKDLATAAVGIDGSVSVSSPTPVLDLDLLDVSKLRTNAFALITGQPVTLASIGLPSVAAKASAKLSFDLDVISADVDAAAKFTSNVRLGYDTKGIAEMIRRSRSGQAPDAAALADGFYLSTGPCAPTVDLARAGAADVVDIAGCALALGAMFRGEARIGPVWGKAGLGAALAFTIDDPGAATAGPEDKGKLRGAALAALTDDWEHPENLLCLFDIKGSGAANLSAGIDPDISARIPGLAGDFSLRALLSDAFGVCSPGEAAVTPPPPPPVLASTVQDDAGSTLLVHVGPNAGLRSPGAVDTAGVSVTLTGTRDSVTVAVDGVGAAQTFSGAFDRVLVEGTPFGDTIDASGLAVPATVRGGAGADTLTGGPAADDLDGGVGADTIVAGAGDDRARGGPGADTIDGGVGNDDLRGDGGADTVTGGPGVDHVEGGAGDDSLQAGDDDGSVLRGGDGGDTLSAHPAVELDGGLGDDTVYLAGDAATTIGRSDLTSGGRVAPFLGVETLVTSAAVVVDGIVAPLHVAGASAVTVVEANAPLTVEGGDLVVDRSGAVAPVTGSATQDGASKTAGTIAGVAPADVRCAACASAEVRLGSGADTFDIAGFPVKLTVQTGAGADTVAVTRAPAFLALTTHDPASASVPAVEADRVTVRVPGGDTLTGTIVGGPGAAGTVELVGAGTYANVFPRNAQGVLTPLFDAVDTVTVDAGGWTAPSRSWAFHDDVVANGATDLVDLGTPARLHLRATAPGAPAGPLAVRAAAVPGQRVDLGTGTVALDIARSLPDPPVYVAPPPPPLPVHPFDEVLVGRNGTHRVDLYDARGKLATVDLTGRAADDAGRPIDPAPFGPGSSAHLAVVHAGSSTRLVVVDDPTGAAVRVFTYDLTSRGATGRVTTVAAAGPLQAVAASPADRSALDGRTSAEQAADPHRAAVAPADELYVLTGPTTECTATRLTFTDPARPTAAPANTANVSTWPCGPSRAAVGRFLGVNRFLDARYLAIGSPTGGATVLPVGADGVPGSPLSAASVELPEPSPVNATSYATVDCQQPGAPDWGDTPSYLVAAAPDRVVGAVVTTTTEDGNPVQHTVASALATTRAGQAFVPLQLAAGRLAAAGPSIVVPAVGGGSLYVLDGSCAALRTTTPADATPTLAVAWRSGDQLAIGNVLPDVASAAPAPVPVPAASAAAPAGAVPSAAAAHPIVLDYGAGTSQLSVTTGDGADLVTIGDVTIPTAVATGNGRDVVTLNGALAAQTIVVDTGAGRDSVAVRATGSADALVVKTGPDGDDVVVGPLAARTVATIDGGDPAGADPADTVVVDTGGTLDGVVYATAPGSDLPATPSGSISTGGPTSGGTATGGTATGGTVTYSRMEHAYLWAGPIVRLAGPAEGAATVAKAFTLDASRSTSPAGQKLRYQFDTDGDGLPDTATSTAAIVTVSPSTVGAHRYGVRVFDDLGRASDASIVVTVAPAPATIRLGPGPGPAVVGVPVSATVDAVVAGDPPVAYTIDWGDGSGPQRVDARALTHTYTAAGTVNVSVSQAFGALAPSVAVPTAASAKLTVVAAPTVTAPASVEQGRPVAVNLAAAGLPSGSWTVRWGDGTVEPVSGTTATHTYLRPGLAAVEATYVAGSSTVPAVGAVVAVVPADRKVTLALSGETAGVVAEGVHQVVLGATFPAGTAPTSWHIDWGDDTPVTVLAADPAAPGSATAPHTFHSGRQTIHVDVRDADGLHDLTKDLQVTDTAPTIERIRLLTATPTEGGDVRLAVDATDVGTRPGNLRYEFFFTGAATPDVVSVDGLGAHTYPEHAAANVRVRVTDPEGLRAEQTVDVAIANAVPTLVVRSEDGTGQEREGEPVTLHVGVVDRGTERSTAFTVDWGDGTTKTYRVGDPVQHVYVDGGATIERDPAIPDNGRFGTVHPSFIVHGTPRTVTVSHVVDPSSPTDGWPGVAASTNLEIHDVPPTIGVTVVGAPAPNGSGGRPALRLGTITDPGQDTVTAYAVQWDDEPATRIIPIAGAPAPGTVVVQPDGRRPARHARVLLTDGDGNHVAAEVDLAELADAALRVRTGASTSASGPLDSRTLTDGVAVVFVTLPHGTVVSATYALAPADAVAAAPPADALGANGDEPNTVLLDVGALPAGTYRLTATVTTATGQHTELVATFTVTPTSPAIRDTAALPGTL